jgi:hypothetical protein
MPRNIVLHRYTTALFASVILACVALSPIVVAQTANEVQVLLSCKGAKVGEPIIVTVQLKNSGSAPVYVAQSLGFMDGGPVGVRVEFWDKSGHPLKRDSFGDGIAKSTSETNLVLLVPGAFYGREGQALHVPKVPGVYRVVATYFDFSNEFLSVGQTRTAEHLVYPVLRGEHSSNTVEVTISR